MPQTTTISGGYAREDYPSFRGAFGTCPLESGQTLRMAAAANLLDDHTVLCVETGAEMRVALDTKNADGSRVCA